MNKHLSDWVFHYNSFDGTWGAAKRENQIDLFNNRKSKNVLSSAKINDLIELINKTNGDESKIKRLIKTSETY